MDFDEYAMIKAFEKCFSYLERIENHLVKIEKKEFGLDGEKLMDSSDLCNLLNVTKKTLERYRRIGKLPFLKIGGKVFYKYTDVVKNMENLKRRDD